MQQIFLIEIDPEEYARQGVSFGFPVPDNCPNPDCLSFKPPKKHGFYERNCLDFTYQGKILIRRYYCPQCRKTISYLPSFCLPYFQYSLTVIYFIIHYYYELNKSFAYIIRCLREKNTNLAQSIQHLKFYNLRFLMRLNTIKLGIREVLLDIAFEEDGLDLKKGASKILDIVKNGFGKIQTFSQRFFQQHKYSFLSPL